VPNYAAQTPRPSLACPPLRPKRSALRAPQGFAPGKASDPQTPQTPQTENTKRGHF
jgi:hypothetical protein